MTEWLKPDKSIVRHRYSVIHYWYEFDDDGEITKGDEIDIFHFDGIDSTFIAQSGRCNSIKYKDIIEWFPIPPISPLNKGK